MAVSGWLGGLALFGMFAHPLAAKIFGEPISVARLIAGAGIGGLSGSIWWAIKNSRLKAAYVLCAASALVYSAGIITMFVIISRSDSTLMGSVTLLTLSMLIGIAFTAFWFYAAFSIRAKIRSAAGAK